jgi:uncharacterized protein (UPF0297 family)
MATEEDIRRDFESSDKEILRNEIRFVFESLRGKSINSLPSIFLGINPSIPSIEFDESKIREMEEDKFFNEFYVAKKWLSQFQTKDLRKRGMNKNRSSQKLKDIVENWSGIHYIPNQALIIAASALNIPFEKADYDSRVVFFPFKEQAILQRKEEARRRYELRSQTLQSTLYVW